MGQNTNWVSRNNQQLGRIFRHRCRALLLCAAMPALAAGPVHAQDRSSTLPPVQVEAPKERTVPRQSAAAKPSTARRRTTRTNKPPKPNTQTAAAPDDGNGPNNNTSGPPLQQVPGLGKTGTKIADLPLTVQIVPRTVVTEQGGTLLRDAIWNASGINSGGQDSLGYFDHFLIRGLNAQVYTDGFSDGDQLGGLVHSLNGVKQIEILEGPGSAMFGSGPPGGTINIVHYDPSPIFHWGTSTQVNSFGGVTNSEYVTGPTTISGLNYRIDTTITGGDAFRDLNSKDYEFRPAFQWHTGDHTFNFAIDARHIEQTPDSYGLIYKGGQPITGVSDLAKYSTPFAFAKQDDIRPTFTDQWDVTNFLTINNRFSYTHREIDAMRNNDSMTAPNSTSGTRLVTNPDGTISLDGRQLRYQNDSDNFFDYQFEPLWKFYTGGIHHTLLTGFEYQRQIMDTNRVTSDLPNINNIFAPVATDSLAALQFMCDSKHSCDDNHLVANYYGLYATDQIDLTDKWKLRVGVRQDWYQNELDPLVTVPNATNPALPGQFTNTGVPVIAGVPESRNDKPLSWNIGTLYHLTNWMAPYIGASQSYLSNFNSENSTNGIGKPESARQYEAGLRFTFLNERIVLNTAVFNVSRDNVATLVAAGAVDNVVFDSQLTNGEEISLIAKVTDQWSILANATHQQTVLTSAPQAVTQIGNVPQGVPANMANAWSIYKFALNGISGFQFGIGANYRDRTWSDTTNVNSVPGFVIGNLLFGWENANWGVSLNVKNFTNKLYFVAANGAGGFVGEGLGAYLTLKYHE